MSKKVLIIGGGFAGLSAATALAERGFRVHVLEGRQVLGGRAYSFSDPQTRDSVDNGQHLFMGCYAHTIEFLRRIGTLDRLKFQMNLSVDFVGDGGRRATLACWPLPSPLHLLSGLLRLSTLSWRDRWGMIRFYRELRQALARPSSVENLTVTEWLTRCGQSERARRHLWDLITVAALNEDPDIACASALVTVLGQAFFDKRSGSRLGLARVGLSDLYAKAARRYLASLGNEVSLQSPAAHLHVSGDRVTAVELRAGTRLEADWVISAVPPSAFLKLIPEETRRRNPLFETIAQLTYAPIISMHLWFDREITRDLFAGLLDTHIQWIFNKSRIFGREQAKAGYVSLVISGAHRFIDWDEKRLLTMAMEELRRLYPDARAAILLRSLVIKESHATLSPTVGSEALRPGPQSPFKNLLIAGDWTRTGLPATIESACLSGHRCADMIAASAREEALPAGVSHA